MSINTQYAKNNICKYLYNECKRKKDRNLYTIKNLVEHGVDINWKNGRECPPLFATCEDANLAIVKYLVEQGTDINKPNEFGETVLFPAYSSRSETIVKYLVEHGARNK